MVQNKNSFLLCGLLLVLALLPRTVWAKDPYGLTVGKAEIYKLSRPASEILVSDPNVADVSLPRPDQLYLLGRGLGDANIFVFDAEGEVIDRLEVHVSVDTVKLTSLLKQLVPTEDVQVQTLNQDLLLMGRVSTPAMAQKIKKIAQRFVVDESHLVDMMTVSAQQQVMLKVHVLEVNKTALKELGTELGYGPDAIGDFSGSFSTSALGLATGSALNGSFVFSPSGSGPFSLGLDVLERQGLARTLAEPNLTAISGENASFLAGGEYPIPVAQDGSGAITIEFRRFGVSLSFTPVVLDEDRISLRLGTEVSSLSNEVEVELSDTRVQGLNIRRAETIVEIGSGGSMMIGGLLQSEIVDTVNGVPGLMNAPIIGQLFRSDSFTRNESELIIVVSPYLVDPYAATHGNVSHVATPQASGLDFGLSDALEHVYGKEVSATVTEKSSSMGYIIE